MYSYYGTITEANEYFSYRLHEEAWTDATASDREKALIRATQIIDALNFKGQKSEVYDEMFDLNGNEIEPYDEDLRAAQVSQELEFPRDEDTTVPQEIKIACWEIAYALLDGVDPDLELENLGVVSQGMASVRTTYSPDHAQVEHLKNGVPSAAAWRYLRPFLRTAGEIEIRRAN